MSTDCHACPFKEISEVIAADRYVAKEAKGSSCPVRKVFKKDAVVVEDASPKHSIIVVCNGILGIQHLLPDGRRTISELFMRGDLIVESRIPADAEVVALTRSLTCVFPESEFEQARRVSERADDIFLSRLAKQSRDVAVHCADIAKKTPPERMASFIFEYRDRASASNDPDGRFGLTLQRREVGDYLALEPETVSRSYSRLARNGAIAVENGNVIQIVDEEKLRRIADGGMPRKRKVAAR